MLPLETRRLIEGNGDEDDDELLLPMLEDEEDEESSESLVEDANDGHRLDVSSTRLSRHLLVATFFILGWNDESDGSAADDDDCKKLGLLLLLPTFRANAKSLLSRSSNWFCVCFCCCSSASSFSNIESSDDE